MQSQDVPPSTVSRFHGGELVMDDIAVEIVQQYIQSKRRPKPLMNRGMGLFLTTMVYLLMI